MRPECDCLSRAKGCLLNDLGRAGRLRTRSGLLSDWLRHADAELAVTAAVGHPPAAVTATEAFAWAFASLGFARWVDHKTSRALAKKHDLGKGTRRQTATRYLIKSLAEAWGEHKSLPLPKATITRDMLSLREEKAVLADAAEDAGYVHQAALDHLRACRAQSPCWAVYAVFNEHPLVSR